MPTKRRKKGKRSSAGAVDSIPLAKRKWLDPKADSFLSSFEWRQVRMQVLKKYGATCMCCGATTADGVRMHVDHIKPRKLFPHLGLHVDNLQVLCEVCNHGKGNWDMTDWRPVETPIEAEFGDKAVRALLKSF